MRLITSSLLILATVAAAAVDGKPLDPPTDGFKRDLTTLSDYAKPIVGRVTNAKRLSMGLAPLKPQALQRGLLLSLNNSCLTGITCEPSHRCNILVKYAVNGTTMGYLARQLDNPGYHGDVQPDQAGSLEVSFNTLPGVVSSDKLDLFAENPYYPSLPWLGFTIILGSGTATTTNFAGLEDCTAQTPPGSRPINVVCTGRGVSETAVWKYNSITQDITVQWIYNDFSSPPAYLVFVPVLHNFGFTNNATDLRRTWGASPVTFTCVSPLPV